MTEMTVATGAATHLRHAVSDGPDGIACVSLPSQRPLALALRFRFGGRFHCSTAAGGCGGALSLAAGEKVRPYFRHVSGAAGCALAADPSAAEQAYEHLHIQQRMAEWLSRQGLRPRLEHVLAAGGRADIQLWVGALEHTIEIQLSTLSVAHWRLRDEGYASQVDKVTWLYGPAVVETLAATQVAGDGEALLVRRGPGTDPVTDDLEIGIRTSLAESWAPLSTCVMTSDGIRAPHIDEARDALRQHRLDLEAAERAEHVARERARDEAERRAREEATRRTHEEAEQRTRAADAAQPEGTEDPAQGVGSPAGGGRVRLGGPPAPPCATTRHLPRGSGREPFATLHLLGWRGWLPPATPALLDALPEGLREPARAMAYLVCRIDLNGPAASLSFPDIDDGHAIQDTLVAAGLVELYDTPSGIIRWRRPE